MHCVYKYFEKNVRVHGKYALRVEKIDSVEELKE